MQCLPLETSDEEDECQLSADVDSGNDDEASVESDTSSLVTRPGRVSERLAALRKRL